jgi:predicted XRE-type DNA-binding protein
MRKLKTTQDEPTFECGSENTFVDLGFPEEKAVNMLARAELMGIIRQTIRDNQWTQQEAAAVLKVKQPRVAEIMGMKTQHYSVEQLITFLTRLGKRISFYVEGNIPGHWHQYFKFLKQIEVPADFMADRLDRPPQKRRT